MLVFLRKYGDLSPDYFYNGSPRSGYKVMPPGAGNHLGVPRDPLDMRALLGCQLLAACFSKMFTAGHDVPARFGGMDLSSRIRKEAFELHSF